jgi:subtilisin family serine protease
VRLEDSRSLTIVDDLDDRDGHGTHVAGIIAGSGTMSSGVYRGIAPEAELIVFKIANGRSGWDSDAISAIEAAIGAGARIINYSHGMRPPESAGSPPWVWPTRRSLLETAFEEASNAGVLCVVAAGNEGPISGTVTRPGGMDCVLTVGAVAQGGVVWSGSGRGPYRRCEALRAGRAESYAPVLHPEVESIPKPDVVAPGVGVSSPIPDCTEVATKIAHSLR